MSAMDCGKTKGRDQLKLSATIGESVFTKSLTQTDERSGIVTLLDYGARDSCLQSGALVAR